MESQVTEIVTIRKQYCVGHGITDVNNRSELSSHRHLIIGIYLLGLVINQTLEPFIFLYIADVSSLTCYHRFSHLDLKTIDIKCSV